MWETSHFYYQIKMCWWWWRNNKHFLCTISWKWLSESFVLLSGKFGHGLNTEVKNHWGINQEPSKAPTISNVCTSFEENPFRSLGGKPSFNLLGKSNHSEVMLLESFMKYFSKVMNTGLQVYAFKIAIYEEKKISTTFSYRCQLYLWPRPC